MATFYFDMDGTIVDLYGVENWLDNLRAENPSPYIEAKPLYPIYYLKDLLLMLQARGHKIGIITWLSKDSSRAYKKAVRDAKKEWLNRYLPVQWDEMHFVQYGTPKHTVVKDKDGYIFDDDDRVRALWLNKGRAINPKTVDITKFLLSYMY